MRRVIAEATKGVFGECGEASLQADVLRVAGGRALLRVVNTQLRRLRAALLLNSRLRVINQAPSILVLV